MITSIKDGIHVVAIDDAPHQRGDSTTELFFIYCKSTFLEKISHAPIQVDGLDATQVILNELQMNIDQFNLILLHGITVGGLNVVDINQVNKVLQKPLIAVTENIPNQNSIYDAVEHVSDSKSRKKLITEAEPLYFFTPSHGTTPLSYHLGGLSETVANQFFTKFCLRSKLPEQLLLAHKIASAWNP